MTIRQNSLSPARSGSERQRSAGKHSLVIAREHIDRGGSLAEGDRGKGVEKVDYYVVGHTGRLDSLPVGRIVPVAAIGVDENRLLDDKMRQGLRAAAQE